MTNDSEVDKSPTNSCEEEVVLRHELPVLYSNELYGSNYRNNVSGTPKTETPCETQLHRKSDLNNPHSTHFNRVTQCNPNTDQSPKIVQENRTYGQWKSRNNPLFKNQSPDMVSDLGKRLENNGPRIVQREKIITATDEEIVRHWGYDEETFPGEAISAFSSPLQPRLEPPREGIQPQPIGPCQVGMAPSFGYESSRRKEQSGFCQSYSNNENSYRTELQHEPYPPNAYRGEWRAESQPSELGQNGHRKKSPPLEVCQPVMYPNYSHTDNSHRQESRRLCQPMTNYGLENSFGMQAQPHGSCHTSNWNHRNSHRMEPSPQGPFRHPMASPNGTYESSKRAQCCEGHGCCSQPPTDKTQHRGANKVIPPHGTPNRDFCCRNSTVPKPVFSERRSDKKKELSLKKLYRIVWLQNEQLAILQKQIDRLTERLNSERGDGKSVGTSEQGTGPARTATASVGVMTSFVNLNWNTSSTKATKNAPEISSAGCSSEEVSEDEMRTEKPQVEKQAFRPDREESFTLQGLEIPVIPEPAASPQTSLHLNMKEYRDSSSSSSDEDEEISESSEGEEDLPPVGWTFYDSVVGQVNNMLTKSNNGVATNVDDGGLNDVRNATFDQLRCLGISFIADADNQSQKRVTFDRSFYQPKSGTANHHKPTNMADSDTSMRINALAMKYLTGGTQSPNGKGDRMQGMALCNVANCNNNLSFATLRYLERYQLAPAIQTHSSPSKQNELAKELNYEDHRRGEMSKPKTKKKYRNSEKRHHQEASLPSSKILDITAIKQQPKLLPKKMAR
ncbi:hypothetical protein AAG570_004352 [Ranatra chinensis]|uniref:BEN domain-containing protein n=1 Tax=Ranatra chinensis TaxID=642074 RepID=A0ABD0Y0L5_9HEMI